MEIDGAIFQQKPAGVYGETDTAPHGVELVPATSLQHRRLSAQPEFVYYLPYLPMALCQSAPDVIAEYAYATNKHIRITHWELDQLLVPGLMKRQIQTNHIFGIAASEAVAFFNFANGIIIQDPVSQAFFRIFVDASTMIEPSVSLAQPAEKILANQVLVYSFAVQTAEALYRLRTDPKNPKSFQVVRVNQKDRQLWAMMMRFWNEDESPIQ